MGASAPSCPCWLSDLPKEFAIWFVNKSVNVKRSKCQSTSHGLSWHIINPVFDQHMRVEHKWVYWLQEHWWPLTLKTFAMPTHMMNICIEISPLNTETSHHAKYSLNGRTAVKSMARKSIWTGYDFYLWFLTLKTSAMPALLINICANLHWNPSTKYRDIASHGMDVNSQWTDGWTADLKAYYFRRGVLYGRGKW